MQKNGFVYCTYMTPQTPQDRAKCRSRQASHYSEYNFLYLYWHTFSNSRQIKQ